MVIISSYTCTWFQVSDGSTRLFNKISVPWPPSLFSWSLGHFESFCNEGTISTSQEIRPVWFLHDLFGLRRHYWPPSLEEKQWGLCRPSAAHHLILYVRKWQPAEMKWGSVLLRSVSPRLPVPLVNLGNLRVSFAIFRVVQGAGGAPWISLFRPPSDTLEYPMSTYRPLPHKNAHRLGHTKFHVQLISRGPQNP